MDFTETCKHIEKVGIKEVTVEGFKPSTYIENSVPYSVRKVVYDNTIYPVLKIWLEQPISYIESLAGTLFLGASINSAPLMICEREVKIANNGKTYIFSNKNNIVYTVVTN